MTSNIGSQYIVQMHPLGFTNNTGKRTEENLKEKVMSALKEAFRPEFLNRIDEIIIFNYLGKPEIKKIVELELKKVEKRLKEKGFKIAVSKEAKELLAEKGYNPQLGARPLKRVIQRMILNPLALKIVSTEIRPGERVIIDADGSEIVFNTSLRKKQGKSLAKASV